MALLDMQHQVNGLVMGAPTVYRLDNVSGMGLGPKRAKRYAIGGAAGVRWGREFRDGNVAVFDGAIVTPGDPAAAWAALVLLRNTWAAETTLPFPNATVNWSYKMPGHAEVTIAGRPDSLDADIANLRLGLVPFQGTFETKTRLVG